MTPSSVRVGAFDYRILTDTAEIKRYRRHADIDDDAEWVAFSDHDRLLIGINPAHAVAAQRRDLLHELLHCCLRLGGVWPDAYADLVAEARGRHGGNNVEEVVVTGLTGPLLGVLRDNPDLTKWLLEP